MISHRFKSLRKFSQIGAKMKNSFLRIYFIASLVLIFVSIYVLLTNKESNFPNDCQVSIDKLLEFERNFSHMFDSQCICDPTKLKDSLESVKHLRRSYLTSQEVFNYLTITFNKSVSMNESLKNRILSEVSDKKNVIQLEIQNALQTTGLETFKTQRLELISKQIEAKIYRLQNPAKHLCQTIPKFVCKLSIDAGFGAGIHEILWCLVSAFHKNQTVILIAKWDKYFGSSDTEFYNIFMPLSTTCDYKELSKDKLVVEFRPNDVMVRKLINQLPKEFGSDLMALVESPNSWFHSQFIGYILRAQPRLQKFIDGGKDQNNFIHPIVGIQVRRTDKLQYKEALYYPVSDYMIHVKDFYDKLDLNKKITKRRVYVASDDPSVLPELIKKYPDYIFIASTSGAQMAFSQSTRYSNSSLWGLLKDVFLLSETDYIVCALSSAICRLSYQLMQFKRKDASFLYRSLDVPFYYVHGLTPVRTAFYNHFAMSSDQWTLKIGDHLHERIRRPKSDWHNQGINGRGWDSYFFASNSSKGDFYKLYPYYKVYDDIELV